MQGESQLSKENVEAANADAHSRASVDADGAAASEKTRDSSTVIAEAAHELRLPIANIKLLVETLLDGALDEREVCKRMLKRAYQEVERLQALVADLLALEQVAEKRHELQCEWLSLRDRALYAIETVSKQAFEKGIKISVEGDNQLIYANRGQLDQVLLNLLENAVKFTPQDGKIWIRGGANEGCFSIEDTGIGMSEAEIPKIFSRFYRIDKGQARGGTGLGLSIVKQVLDLHGAKISVKSTEGVGSCFELEFPSPNAFTTRSQTGG